MFGLRSASPGFDMNKIKFLFAVHNHQPVGNFEHVFEELYQKSYSPYFEVLSAFPELKTSVHFSGPLLEWLKKNQPQFLRKVRDRVASGNLEILSGGFYEPILSSLPDEDAIGQIRMMNEFIAEEFDYRPQGLWLAERIWTPELPKILHAADIRYTILDDTHFYYSGLEERQIHGYFITEKHGHPLYVFPINKTLRYGIPFKMPEETLAALGRAREEYGADAVTYADDGEKFGGWPETHQWVYEEKWLEKFFSALTANSDWVETLTFSEYMDRVPPVGRIYLPMASYDEMMEWSLPTEAGLKFHQLKEEMISAGMQEEKFRTFLRGGGWDNFFTKYSESNHQHKRMLAVSRKVNGLPKKDLQSSAALKELYQAQCNCAQWHGLFGGIYLNYLRHAQYSHLIAAENIADSLSGQQYDVETVDFNMDGSLEVIVSSPEIKALFSPAYGGSLMELDYRPKCFNLSNVVKRREEQYHKTLRENAQQGGEGGGQPQSIHDHIKFKEANLENHLFFDRWERYSFLDRFLGSDASLETFKRGQFEESGDFVDAPFLVEEAPAWSDGPLSIPLKRRGSILQEGRAKAIEIEKVYRFNQGKPDIQVDYRISNLGKEPLNLWWGVEFNFTLLAGDAEDRYYTCPEGSLGERRLNSQGVIEGVQSVGLRDDWNQFELLLSSASPATLWRYPIETVSQSENGFERTYQGSCIFFHWQFVLPASGSRLETFHLKIIP